MVILAAIATTVFYPPMRKAIERFVKRHIEAGTASCTPSSTTSSSIIQIFRRITRRKPD